MNIAESSKTTTIPSFDALVRLEGAGRRIRDCVGFPDYMVTEDGRVWSKFKKRWRKSHPNSRSGYIQVTMKGSNSPVYVHRLVAETFIGPNPGGLHIDHINRDRSDNRACNLRWTTVSQNAANCRGRSPRSGFKGVHPLINGTWSVRFNRGKVRHHIGTFGCPIEAAKAYDEAVRKIDGEFAITNFK